MAKRTPGEYAPLRWDGDGNPHAHYVSGHVTEDEFRLAVNAYHGDRFLPSGTAITIKHVYVRVVRAPAESDFDTEWRECKPGRGAMKMTVWNVKPNRNNWSQDA